MSSYSTESNKNNRNGVDEGSIDFGVLFGNALKGFKKFWLLFFLLIIAFAVAGYFFATRDYREEYSTQTTVAINTSEGSDVTDMLDTFSYLLTCDAMKNAIAEELEIKTVPARIKVDIVENTNFLFVTVTADDGEMSYRIMNSLLDNYTVVTDMLMFDLIMDVVEPPEVPTSPSNRIDITRSIMRGALIGAAIGLAVIFGYAALRRTIQKKEDISNELHLPCLGVVPEVRLKKRSYGNTSGMLITAPNAEYHYQEAFKVIRRKIENDSSSTGNKIYLISSASQNEGKSTISTNIALSLAEKGYRVVLVDADIRKPTVKRIFRYTEKSASLQDVLYKGFDVNDKLFVIEPKTGLYVLGGAEGTKMASEVLASSAYMDSFLDYLRSQFDYVIIDTPPVGLIADAKIIGEHADAAIFVVRSDFMRIPILKDAVEDLWTSNISIIGAVLNGSEKTGGRYGDYYYKSYYRYRRAR